MAKAAGGFEMGDGPKSASAPTLKEEKQEANKTFANKKEKKK